MVFLILPLLQMQSRFGDSYFLLSGAETTGSPPRRMPPPVTAHNYNNKYTSRGSDLSGSLSSYEYELKRATSESTRSVPRNQVHILKIGLPTLQTGILIVCIDHSKQKLENDK